MSRRLNGEGTVSQRQDGRWEAAAYVPIADGTRRRVRQYARTKAEASQKLRELLRNVDLGIPVATRSWRLDEYMTHWLEHTVKPDRRPKTYQGYESMVRLHITPALGKKRLGALTASEVRAFLSTMTASGKFSPRMVQLAHAVLRNALEQAVREEVIPRNVAKLVRPPAPRYRIGRGLSAEQARKLLEAARDDRFSALYVLALYVGLRRGELLGLRWQDVDLDRGTLEVVQTLQRIDGELRFVPPKTERSVRTVPLPGVCIRALREHRARQAEERLAAGAGWTDSGLVFATRHGTPVEPDNLRRSWHPLRKAIGQPDLRFHDLRHTCVTLLLELGAPPHVVREIVGHSDIQVTMTIYAHASLDEKRRALSALDERLA